MRGRRRVVHSEGLELTKVISRTLSCFDRSEEVEMLRNVFLSQEDETFPATVTHKGGEEESTVEETLVM